jgi:2-polyprenyl-3-methyl-5-hydroxy-6-metoxy-1,4-benzoquinol methylase
VADAFYDELAEDYHLIFADWQASIARQAEVLRGLLGDARTVLDAACGIGTQALGLAAAGYDVTATDLGAFDAVVCMDNALPHLLTDEDLALACAALRRSVVPGGVLLASIRDYDARPTGDPARVLEDRTVEQIWEWQDEERHVLRHRIVRAA